MIEYDSLSIEDFNVAYYDIDHPLSTQAFSLVAAVHVIMTELSILTLQEGIYEILSYLQ